MPRPSTVLVVKATCALIFLILLGQIFLFILCRCRGIGEEEPQAKRTERSKEIRYQKKLKQLSDAVRRLQQTHDVQNSVIEGLTLRNRKLTQLVTNFEKAEKLNEAQGLSRIKSGITEAEFLKNEPVKSEYEVLPFDAIAPNAIYQTTSHLSGNPAERPYGNKGKDYYETVNFALNVLNNEFENSDMRTSSFDLVDGIMRTDSLFGTQYDLYFRTMELNVYRRIKILRPFDPLTLSGSIETVDTNDELINVIIPLSGRIDKFRTFMKNFVDVAIRWDRRVYLTVVFFGEEGRTELETLIRNVSKADNFTAYKLVLTNETFSRGLGLQKGVLAWDRGNVLMFFCDVDIYFTAEFLERCRMYSSPGTKLYYPIVFSLYNPMIVYGGTPPPLVKQFRINKETGFWRGFGFGMTCQYRNDFLKTGGFDLSIKGWGKEDVKLYRQHLAGNLIVIRAVDRGIFHVWHHKYCNRTLSEQQFMACIKSKVRSEASAAQLGLLAFGNKIFGEEETNWIDQLQASVFAKNPPAPVEHTIKAGDVRETEAPPEKVKQEDGLKEQSKTPEVHPLDKKSDAGEDDKNEDNVEPNNESENYLDYNDKDGDKRLSAEPLRDQSENGKV